MEHFKQALSEAVAEAAGMSPDEVFPLFEVPPKRSLGDLAFPCFSLARRMRKAPPAIASDLEGKVDLPDFVERVVSAGPYLNFRIAPEALCRTVLGEVRARGEAFGNSSVGGDRVVVVDYSSPNISKHLAFHHIRSTMIGQSLVRLHRASGWKTVGINHLGDWGTTFGKLMVAVSSWTEGDFLGRATLKDLNDLYVRFHREAQTDAGLEDRARAWFKRLEEGDAEATRMWKAFREISLEAFDRVYGKLGVSFDHVIGESFFLDRLDETVERVASAGLLEESEGAQVVPLEAEGLPPGLLRKKDGATLYLTRDLAAAIYRRERFGFDRALYVTDAGQSLHFKQLFAVLRRLGFDAADDMHHVPFGVLLMGGQKGGSRRGEVVLLERVLDEAAERTLAMIEEKNPDLPRKEEVARAVGVGAVVFNDLKNKRIKDVRFRWEEVLNLEGDSGPYVQYAFVRACGIFRKHGGPPPAEADLSRLEEEEELELVQRIGRFPETVRRACETFEPSVVAQHLLDLSAAFHRFHHKHRVLSDDAALTDARLMLVDGARTTLRRGLDLLGIEAVEEM